MNDNNNLNKWAITIGREFGSGGREIGRLVAQKLGISYYDKELLNEAAKRSGVNEQVFEANDERSPRFFGNPLSLSFGFAPSAFYSMGSSPLDSIYQAQTDVMQQLVDQGPCVIVGRTADYVLRDYCHVVSVFIHAPIEVCVQRIMRRGECTDEKQARDLAMKKNKLRASYYNFYTDKQWGAAATYDLCIDSSLLGPEATAEFIAQYVKRIINLK